MNLTSLKSAHSLTRSTGAWIGNGRKITAQRLRMVGSPKADFSHTVGKATMRRCSYIHWDLVRLPIRYPRAATQLGLPPTSGSTVTDMTIFTPGHYSPTSSHISG